MLMPADKDVISNTFNAPNAQAAKATAKEEYREKL